jgi:hypothetical protein
MPLRHAGSGVTGFSLGGRMTILPTIRYRRFPAAMLGMIMFAFFGVVTISCNVPAVAAAQGKLELTDQGSVDRCTGTVRARISASPDCCCTPAALAKGETPKPAKVATLLPSAAHPALLHPVFAVVTNADQAQQSSEEVSLPVYLATQRLRI